MSDWESAMPFAMLVAAVFFAFLAACPGMKAQGACRASCGGRDSRMQAGVCMCASYEWVRP